MAKNPFDGFTLPSQQRSSPSGYKSVFSDINTDDWRKTEQARAATAVKPVANNPKPRASLFTRAKETVKKTVRDTVESAKDTGAKTLNTTSALGVNLFGLGKAGVEAATGKKAAANDTLSETRKTSDALLDNGIRGKGGFLTAKQAKSSGGGAKSYKEDFVKPVLKGAAEVSPYVAPTAKGATLLRTIGKNAGIGAAQSAITDVASQAVDKGKVDLKQTAKQAALGGVISGAAGAFDVGTAKAVDKAKSGGVARKDLIANTKTKALLDASAKAPIGKLDKNHDAYFNTRGKKQAVVPTKDLEFTHKPEDQPDSVNNAERLMADAAFNNGSKRDPVLVHVGADGKRTVLDGNATAAVAQKQGWDDIPASIITSKEVPTAAHVDAAKMVMERAKRADPEFQGKMASIAKDLGTDYQAGPVKDIGRSLTKMVEKYGGDHTKLKDTVRGTMVLHDHTPEGIAKVVDTIRKVYPDAKVKNGYEAYKSGYVDVKVSVKTPEGHTAEIILASPEMLKAKHELGGHDQYRIYRDDTKTPAEQAIAEQKMKDLYGNAHAAANRRLASSSDLLYSETKKSLAVSGETASPAPSGKPPTERVAPVKTTVSKMPPPSRGRTASTTSSSVIKKEGESIPSTVADKSKLVNDKVQQGTSKVGASVQQKAVERGLKDTFGESAQYDKITIADQAKKAVALTADKDKLQRVISGAEALPGDLRATALIKAVEEHPTLGKDPEIIRALANSTLASESSRSAQELRLAAERYEHSPVEAIRSVSKAREAAIERKTGKTPNKAISAEIKAIRKAKPVVKKESWDSFIEGLKC